MMITYTATITQSFNGHATWSLQAGMYNNSFDAGARGREKLQTLCSKIFLLMIVTGK